MFDLNRPCYMALFACASAIRENVFWPATSRRGRKVSFLVRTRSIHAWRYQRSDIIILYHSKSADVIEFSLSHALNSWALFCLFTKSELLFLSSLLLVHHSFSLLILLRSYFTRNSQYPALSFQVKPNMRGSFAFIFAGKLYIAVV